MTQVPGQVGPYYTITDKEYLAALDAILEKPGARDLVSELYQRMMGERTPASFIGRGVSALDELLKTQGADNLIGELRRRQCKRVPDLMSIFDMKTAGMIFGPNSVIKGLWDSVVTGTAENHTYHFAMTAIAYAIALEEMDPNFFKDKKHVEPSDPEGYETRRQKVLAYVKAKAESIWSW